MAEDGREEKKRMMKQGGFKTMPFILACDFCDKFATTGFNINMISYLTQQLHLPLVEASNTLTNFKGTASLTPIIGGIIADAYAGRFWSITVGSVIYQLGMLSLTISAVLPALRPPSCAGGTKMSCQPATSGQLTFLYMSLFLTSIGLGGIRPCVVAFGADQFDLDAHRNKVRKWDFFNLYFFAMGAAELLGQTVAPYIQDNIGWGWGLGIPTLAMTLSVIAFVIGYSLYVMVKPTGSPVTRLAQVVVAAIRKRRAGRVDDHTQLFENKEMDAQIATAGKLIHTNNLLFLDRAAIVSPGDFEYSGAPKLWRLSTVHRVEELKSLIRLLPLWASGIILVTSASHNYSFAVQQARTMDRHFSTHSSFQIPPASLSIFSSITMLLTLALYDRLFIPFARSFTGKPSGITYIQRLGLGMAIGLFANVAAALVETKRKSVAAEFGLLDHPNVVIPMSVFWLVPQYAIHGIGEAITAAAQMEFLYDQAPESMRSMAASLYWLTISIGNYLGTFMVTVVDDRTKGSGDWLQDNINRGKLDYYYWLVTALQAINFVYYVICAMFYTWKPIDTSDDDNNVVKESSNLVQKNTNSDPACCGDRELSEMKVVVADSDGGRSY